MVSTLSFPEGLKLGMDEVFNASMKIDSFEFPEFFKMGNTSDAFVTDYQYQTPDTSTIVGENGQPWRLDISKVRTKTHYVVKMFNEIPVSYEALKFLKYGELIAATQALSLAFYRGIERIAQSILSLGFTSSLGPDNVSLFNGSHTLTQPQPGRPTSTSNFSTLSLSPINLESRRQSGLKQLDENGSPVKAVFDQLIVGPDLYYKALNIVGSTNQAYTADNTRNSAKGLNVVLATYFQEAAQYASTMWILRDSKLARNRFIWVEKPHTWTEPDVPTNGQLYRGQAMFAVGCSHYNGLDGNNGTT